MSSFHFPMDSGSPRRVDRKRGSIGAEFVSLKQFEQRRMSLSLVSNNDLDDRHDEPERSASPEIQTRSTTGTATQETARSTAQVTFEDEAPTDRSYRFPAQVVKIPGFLRFPGNAVRSQKLTNMIRQRLSISGLQLGPQIGQRPPPSAASMSTAVRAGLWLEQSGAGVGDNNPDANSFAPIPAPPSFPPVPPPPAPGGNFSSPNAPTNAPSALPPIPPPPPPSGTFAGAVPIPSAPPGASIVNPSSVAPVPPAPPPLNLAAGPSVSVSLTPPASANTPRSTTGFPPLPPNPTEELNTNPFTAAYRNFPESSLKEVYIFLHEIGREIEQFAYKVLVEQHYHLGENGGEAEASHSSLMHRSSSSFQKGKTLKNNYFCMAPRVSVVQPFAEQLSTASATSAGGFIYNSHSCSDVFFGGGGHSKSIDSMRSGLDDVDDDDDDDEKNSSSIKPPKTDMDDFPHCVENNYFLYTEDWFDEFPLPCPIVEAKVAATTEPPIFFAGMLMDPVSERFLFSGTTFYEEARVLKVGVSKGDASPKDSGIITWFNQQPKIENTPKTFAKILLREYISMCREHEGFIVQTFSILDSDVRIDARRNQLVAPSVLPKLLDRLQPGAITRAFSLQHVITLKSLQDEALADMRPSAIPDIPRFPTTIKKDESFRNTSLFTSNIVRRYTTHGHQHQSPDRKNQTTTALWLKRRFRRDNAVSSDHYAFLSDENPMRPLFETEMQQNAPMYVKPIDNIKAFLIFFKDTFSFYAMVRVLFAAVRCLQRFFRYCLGKKRRALARMLRLWRHLESECRLKLQHYHPAPSSAERIDMIAANVLQPYMITTREYKEALIQELWKARRHGYQKWCRDRAVDAHLRSAGATILSPAYRNVIPQLPAPEIRGIVSFVEVEPALDRAMKELHPDGVPYEDSDSSGNPLYSGRESSRMNNNVTPVTPHVFNAVESSRKNRLEDEVHQLFGWYIEPEKLLYESHHRLLTSLKESVLSMEEVQMEMQNLSMERAERRGAIINPDDLRAFAATP